MNVGVLLAIISWAAAVSFVSALKIPSRAMTVLVAVTSSFGIPLALGILYTSLFPWASLGPEELLQQGFETLIGAHAANLPQTLAAGLAGLGLGFGAAYVLIHSRRREK